MIGYTFLVLIIKGGICYVNKTFFTRRNGKGIRGKEDIMERNTTRQGVKCKCGEMPELGKRMDVEGPEYRLECPKCRSKNAPWRRSQLAACGDWEGQYHSL